LRCAVLLFQQIPLRSSLEPEREQTNLQLFSQTQKPKLPIAVIKKKKKTMMKKRRRRRRRRRALKIGAEIAMAKKHTRKERRQELRAVSLAAAHPHLWMQEIIQRLFIDGRNHPKVLCRCGKSSKSYFWMEESMERLFVDGGSHPKVICRWRKSSKGYFMCTTRMQGPRRGEGSSQSRIIESSMCGHQLFYISR